MRWRKRSQAPASSSARPAAIRGGVEIVEITSIPRVARVRRPSDPGAVTLVAFVRDIEAALPRSVAAVSVGIIDGEPRLDLHYEDDVRADTDMNVVMTGDGAFVEVQGTAEGTVFDRALLNQLLDLATTGCSQLTHLQQAAIRP